MKLTRQQRRVLDFIKNNRGATTKDIMLGTGIQCPSGRITELRQAGVNIISVGKKKYPGAHAFEMYAIAPFRNSQPPQPSSPQHAC
jgi:Helix-turn-helix domain